MRVKRWPNGYPGLLGPPGDQETPAGSAATSPVRGHREEVSDRSDTPSLPGVDEWLGKKGKPTSRKRSTTASKTQIERAVEGFEQARMVRAWGEMEATHFLGLYVVCHRRVYGTEPTDLFATWAGAVGAVRAMLKHEFADEPARMVAYLQWAWSREQGREKHRRANGGGDYRLAWRYLFVRQAAAGMLTDWRTSLARAAQTRSGIKAG